MLEKEIERTEKELSTIAHKTPGEPGGWTSNHPRFNVDGPLDLESETDEVEIYINNLPIEQRLETRLANLRKSLERLKQGTYGICTQCNKKINVRRLEILPETDVCSGCHTK